MCVCGLLVLLNWIQQGYFLSFLIIGRSVFYASEYIFYMSVCVFCQRGRAEVICAVKLANKRGQQRNPFNLLLPKEKILS